MAKGRQWSRRPWAGAGAAASLEHPRLKGSPLRAQRAPGAATWRLLPCCRAAAAPAVQRAVLLGVGHSAALLRHSEGVRGAATHRAHAQPLEPLHQRGRGVRRRARCRARPTELACPAEVLAARDALGAHAQQRGDGQRLGQHAARREAGRAVAELAVLAVAPREDGAAFGAQQRVRDAGRHLAHAHAPQAGHRPRHEHGRPEGRAMAEHVQAESAAVILLVNLRSAAMQLAGPWRDDEAVVRVHRQGARPPRRSRSRSPLYDGGLSGVRRGSCHAAPALDQRAAIAPPAEVDGLEVTLGLNQLAQLLEARRVRRVVRPHLHGEQQPRRGRVLEQHQPEQREGHTRLRGAVTAHDDQVEVSREDRRRGRLPAVRPRERRDRDRRISASRARRRALGGQVVRGGVGEAHVPRAERGEHEADRAAARAQLERDFAGGVPLATAAGRRREVRAQHERARRQRRDRLELQRRPASAHAHLVHLALGFEGRAPDSGGGRLGGQRLRRVDLLLLRRLRVRHHRLGIRSILLRRLQLPRALRRELGERKVNRAQRRRLGAEPADVHVAGKQVRTGPAPCDQLARAPVGTVALERAELQQGEA
eukprot:scaffold52039_cov65-Phaeocystis_antarctica.AAC.3